MISVLIIGFGLAILVVFLVWLIGLSQTHDLAVPARSLAGFKKILFISPHPDDETLCAGGTLALAASLGKQVTVAVLTEGEYGTPNGQLDETLRTKRHQEAQAAAKILGVSELIQENFGDGQLSQKKPQLFKYLEKLISSQKPDLVITYDQSGLYGHPDHIVVSQIVTQLAKSQKMANRKIGNQKSAGGKNGSQSPFELWYPTYPTKVLATISLPTHMAKDPEFIKKRTLPLTKFGVGWTVWQRVKAVYAYVSQFNSFEKELPYRPIPLWFFYSMEIWEYYHQAKLVKS